jgi:hypothetical protein
VEFMYWILLINISVVFLGELFCIAWIYGIDNFCDDIALMLGEERRPKILEIYFTTYTSCNYILSLIIHEISFLHMPFTVYNYIFFSILSRCYIRWLHISIMGTCTWLVSSSSNMSWLTSLYIFCWNMSSWDVECMFRIVYTWINCFFSSPQFIDH